MKTCSTCKETKPITEFRKAKGPDYLCKDCNRAKAARWRAGNPGRNAAGCREWYYRNQRRVRNSALQKNYGITIDEYETLALNQNFVCAICAKQSKDGILRVDHEHETGYVRGLLCDTCNRAIGLLGDDAIVLRAAAEYLESSALRYRGTSGTVTTLGVA